MWQVEVPMIITMRPGSTTVAAGTVTSMVRDTVLLALLAAAVSVTWNVTLGALPGVQVLPPQSITTVVLDRIITVGGASNPTPTNGATGIGLTSSLSWTAGSNAALHAVYLGTSSNAVAVATPASPQFLGLVTNTTFSPTLFANVPNYWRVDEIAGINTNTGAVWAFSPAPIVKLTGTIIGSPGSWNNTGNTIAKVFDGNTGTFYDAVNGTGDWAGIDLSNTNSTLVQIKYCPRATFAARMLGGQFQGANVPDFSSGVVTLFTISATPPDGVMTVQTITNTTSCRYLRYIGPANGFCNVAEVEFWGISNTAPTLAAITDQTIGVGMMLSLTNVATDADAPPQRVGLRMVRDLASQRIEFQHLTKLRRDIDQQEELDERRSVVKVRHGGRPALAGQGELPFVAPGARQRGRRARKIRKLGLGQQRERRVVLGRFEHPFRSDDQATAMLFPLAFAGVAPVQLPSQMRFDTPATFGRAVVMM